MILKINFSKLIVFTAIVLATAISSLSAGNANSLWRQTNEDKLPREKRAVTPEKYLVFRLNQAALKDALAVLPLENISAARSNPLVLEIPMPDGTLQKFRMEQTAVLSPELAAEFPDWKSFTGYGVDNPNAVGQFDWNVNGFHGYISTGRDTAIIDPYQKGDTENYLVYNKSEYGASDNEFYCSVEKTMKKITESDSAPDFLPSAPEFTFGTQLRTYRIAIATTGEWSRNAAGAGATTPIQIRTGALAVVMTTVTRLNGIYTRELASAFQLVNPAVNDNTRNIIFDDPATDPYNNTDQAEDKAEVPATPGPPPTPAIPATINQLRVNQETLDNRVGTANYDIGHLYGTGGGGVAASPSLCRDGRFGNPNAKAQGYSARGNDTGDPFTVDYVAHEIGHQFGASHTYNNADPDGACTTRSAANAFEVASGATIMSYVGICSQRNLQQYVDTGFPSFHIRSLTQIDNNIRTDAPSPMETNCGTLSGTNTAPTVSAGAAYTIPRLTPFTLTAIGADADGGDVANLLYSWEEYDLAPSPSGASGTPPGTYDVDTDGVLRPLFRPYSPVSSNQRTFPSLTFILNPDANNNDATANVNGVTGNQPRLEYTGTHPTGAPGAVCQANSANPCVVGERLPTVSRTMNFRVSTRDRRGGVMDAGTTVTIAGGAGPFQVTVQNSATNAVAATWQSGTTQTVNWDVAGTDANNINAANVNILLSTDGGQTFPITLKANTPNDGTEAIIVPNNQTTTARIKVQPINNIFFDINNANFSIVAGPTAAPVTVFGRVTNQRGRGILGATVRVTDANGIALRARTNSFGYFNFAEIAAGQTYIFAVSAKGYSFAPQVANLSEDQRINFQAQ